MKKIHICYSFLILGLYSSCSKSIHKELNTFTNSQKFEVHAAGENVYSWSLKLKGNINGNIVLYFKENNDYVVDSLLLSGNINLNKQGDWFVPKLILEFKPLNQTTGNLIFDCSLYSF